MENLNKDEIKEEVNQDVASDLNQTQDEAQNLDAAQAETSEVDSAQSESVESDTMDAAGDTLTPNPEEQGEEEQSIDPVTDQGENSEEEINQEPNEKMLPQSQVNELIGKARQEGRESALKELLGRYGVSTEGEMNDIFGRGQAYDDLNDEFTNQGNSLKDVMAENALLKSHIIPERWDDVKLILGGKGLDVSAENIAQMMATHPEWAGKQTMAASLGAENGESNQFSPEMGEQLSKVVQPTQEQPGTLRKMGNQVSSIPQESDDDVAQRLFGFKK